MQQLTGYRRSQIFRAKNILCANIKYGSCFVCTNTINTATMDTFRILEKERRDKLILLETVLQNHSLNQLSNVDRLDRD